jgi:hypothetical protein
MIYIITSIPKSGTHLMDAWLQNFLDGRVYSLFCNQAFYGGGTFLSDLAMTADMMRKGTYHVKHLILKAHFFYVGSIAEAVLRHSDICRMFFLYRDPRDHVVSFVKSSLDSRMMIDPISSAIRRDGVSFNDRCRKYMEGKYRPIEGKNHPSQHGLRKIYMDRLGWVNSAAACNIKYEEIHLIPDEVSETVADYTGADLSVVREALDKAMGAPTVTLREGGQGGWLYALDGPMQEYFKNYTDVFTAYGYPI